MQTIRIQVKGSVLNTLFSASLQEETFGSSVIGKNRP